MNWSSVKNLLIAMLIAANVFLIFNIVRQDRTRGYISEDEVNGAIELLEERGLSVSRDAVPLKRFEARVYESLYNENYYTECAVTLANSNREMLYTLPGGGISIATANGSNVDFDTEFGFRYASAGISDVDAYTGITVKSFEGDGGAAVPAAKLRTLTESAERFLSARLSEDSPLSVNVVGSYSVGNMTYLLARQTVDGYELYSHFAICIFSGEELVYAHGRWYFSDVSSDYRAELCDQVSILFTDMKTLNEDNNAVYDRLNGDSAVQSSEDYKIRLPGVTAVKPCYAIYWNVDKTAIYLIPAWQIDHVGSVTTVYNATNGIIYSKSQ